MMIATGIFGLLSGIRMLMKAFDTSALRTVLFGVGSHSTAFGIVGACLITAGIFSIVNSLTRDRKFATFARILYLASAITCVVYGYAELRALIEMCLLYSVLVLWNHKKPAKA